MKKFITFSYYKLCDFYKKNGHKTEPEWIAMTLLAALISFNIISIFFIIIWIIHIITNMLFEINKYAFLSIFLFSFIWCYFSLFKRRDEIIGEWELIPQKKHFFKYSVLLYLTVSIFLFFLLLVGSALSVRSAQ